MQKLYYETDVDPSLIQSLKVAVLGYGNQGHAHALNLKDQGVEVRTGLPLESRSRARAEADGMPISTVEEAADWADVLMFCTPDVPMKDIYRDSVAARLRPGQTLLFAHGLSVHFKLIQPPAYVDVAMVAPKGPGRGLRQHFLSGKGLPALIAVQQDASGHAWDVARSYAWGIGCARGGLLDTTFREETETDLFGEQAVLCGGIPELVKAGFETLIEAGYTPEAAYFECLHETKLIVDLLYEGGLTFMRHAISDTAEWGGFNAGPKIVNEASREAMRGILSRIQSGEFVKEWVAESEAGIPRMRSFRAAEAALQVEEVGKALRRAMPIIDQKEIEE